MRQQGKRLAGVLGIALLCLLCAGCGKGEDQTRRAASETPDRPVQEAPTDIVIETEFGVLHYPEQWQEFVNVQQERQGEGITVLFTAQINGTEYPLFDAVIGNGEGVQVGDLTDADGRQRPVFIRMTGLEEDPDLAENEQNRLYAMQEDLNYLIDHLQ